MSPPRSTLRLRRPPDAPPAIEEVPQTASEAEQANSFAHPDDWRRGQLLNVRNAGSHYNVTLLAEEYDVRYPERCLQFQNSHDCQTFVSWWYAPQESGR
jgi:hypothetical protein